MAIYVKDIGLTKWFKEKILGITEVTVRARNKKEWSLHYKKSKEKSY